MQVPGDVLIMSKRNFGDSLGNLAEPAGRVYYERLKAANHDLY